MNVKPQLAINGVTVAEGAGLKIGQDLLLKVSLGGNGKNQSGNFPNCLRCGDAL
ncbi:MAG: hypothetical protein Q8L68_05450 [Methylococcales bacterium]|nr:hypothetical protein [Methylococcales bacterium]